jgi:hypothetical protein
MGQREYNPTTASFTSRDPAADPLVPNGYSYTPANPLAYTDPTGTTTCEIGYPVLIGVPCGKPKGGGGLPSPKGPNLPLGCIGCHFDNGEPVWGDDVRQPAPGGGGGFSIDPDIILGLIGDLDFGGEAEGNGDDGGRGRGGGGCAYGCGGAVFAPPIPDSELYGSFTSGGPLGESSLEAAINAGVPLQFTQLLVYAIAAGANAATVTVGDSANLAATPINIVASIIEDIPAFDDDGDHDPPPASPYPHGRPRAGCRQLYGCAGVGPGTLQLQLDNCIRTDELFNQAVEIAENARNGETGANPHAIVDIGCFWRNLEETQETSPSNSAYDDDALRGIVRNNASQVDATVNATTSSPSMFSRGSARTNADVLSNGGGLPLAQSSIDDVAARGGVGLEGVNVRILSGADDIRYLDSQQAAGFTSDGTIYLGPAAFANEETLLRTLAHERTHIYQQQIWTIGSGNRLQLEDAAYSIEDTFWDYFQPGGR